MAGGTRRARPAGRRRSRSGRRRGRLFLILFVLLLPLLIAGGLAGYTYWETRRPPIVRHGDVLIETWPKGVPPVTVLLVSDSHVSQPDMPPGRLESIVRQLDALHPDLVLLAGDYIGHKLDGPLSYDVVDAIAPLGGFHAPLGVVAVLGNHDNGKSAAVIAELKAQGITPLVNEAVRRGPLVIGGMSYSLTAGRPLDQTLKAMARLGPGPQVLLTHAPDVALELKGPVDAILAGHSHCGQIVLPFHGPLRRESEPSRWLACGKIDVGRPLFVTAGLGTSDIPWRFGAAPDVWLIRFGPAL